MTVVSRWITLNAASSLLGSLVGSAFSPVFGSLLGGLLASLVASAFLLPMSHRHTLRAKIRGRLVGETIRPLGRRTTIAGAVAAAGVAAAAAGIVAAFDAAGTVDRISPVWEIVAVGEAAVVGGLALAGVLTIMRGSTRLGAAALSSLALELAVAVGAAFPLADRTHDHKSAALYVATFSLAFLVVQATNPLPWISVAAARRRGGTTRTVAEAYEAAVGVARGLCAAGCAAFAIISAAELGLRGHRYAAGHHTIPLFTALFTLLAVVAGLALAAVVVGLCAIGGFWFPWALALLFTLPIWGALHSFGSRSESPLADILVLPSAEHGGT